jgi:hypothetical protein
MLEERTAIGFSLSRKVALLELPPADAEAMAGADIFENKLAVA